MNGAGRAFAELTRGVDGSVQRSVPLSTLTTFRLGGPAEILVVAEDESDLALVGKVASGEGLDVLLLGRGSNLLLSDLGFTGVVVKLGRQFSAMSGEGAILTAGGAAPFPQAANWAARRGLAGLEFAIAIPGSIGGAVKMNAGAHGRDAGAVLERARIVSLDGGRAVEVSASELSMTYRHSEVEPGQAVVSATFRLQQEDRVSVTERMDSYRKHRALTQPLEANNAGSMFKNPKGNSAGRLIESAGLKGAAVGGVEVSAKHGNFFIAHEGGSAQNAYELMALVQRSVKERFDILLEPEVRIVGMFDESAGLVRP